MRKGFIAMVIVLVGCAFVLSLPASPKAEPIVLKWTSHEPDKPGSTQDALKEFASRIDKETQGRVKIKVYWGSVLGKVTDYIKMVGGKGVADGGFLVTTYYQWEIPLWSASQLPFLTRGYKVGPKALWELYHEWPAMQEEMKKVNIKPLWPLQPHPHEIGTTDQLTKLDDFKGKKLWCSSLWPKVVEQFGIINIMISAPESYEAWQRGTIDGVWGMPTHTFRIFRYYELGKNMISLEFAGGNPICVHAINLDVWNKISPQDQKAIEEISAQMIDRQIQITDKEKAGLEKFLKEKGVKHIEFSPEDQARIKGTRQLVWDEWLKTAREKGIPGDEFLKRYQAKIKKFER
jgi:TRAP-type C4-dicarboxylate transport system substrate-binding protein